MPYLIDTKDPFLVSNRVVYGKMNISSIVHWTELGRFKERIGTEAFERLCYRILEEAERLGIEISNKRNADATATGRVVIYDYPPTCSSEACFSEVYLS